MIRLLSTLVRLAGDILSCLNHILQLLQESGLPDSGGKVKAHTENNTEHLPEKPDVNAYTEEELCTVGEACLAMNVSRSHIDRMRNRGEFTKLENKNGRVRLVKAEVEAAKIWYSKRKGKL
ncbi:hypothetical protein SAMN05660841_04286 [Sphingobacterium nematocida]|uniref:Helix-turn-helix domain-containing protein n=1 Tax=Sphingobacterium nematocida TaxID=1513896 RepID=A0A1T5GR41_9SPHI|nr:helix-turn-helix domain-containing protein [Sphingobacterium nematocida]SKC10861.1 hypothetical protein SAMN05660841_04286 [Sphingobacterium nematocida]